MWGDSPGALAAGASETHGTPSTAGHYVPVADLPETQKQVQPVGQEEETGDHVPNQEKRCHHKK